MDARPLIPGVWSIDLIADGGHEFVREFLDELEVKRPAEYRKMLNLLITTAQHGPPHNEEKFKTFPGVPGQLAEFKAHQVRIPCFFDGEKRIVVTHGFIKKKTRTEPEEIQRALFLRDAYQMAKKTRERRGRKS